jgi:outer membrane lipoprotein carrier protein
MKFLRGLIMFVGCGVMAASSAAAQSAQDVLEKARKKYEELTDVELRFTQEAKFPVSHVEQRINGTLQMRKGNRYRVETEDMTVVTDGTTVWSYSRGTNQVLIDHFSMDERMFSPERILTAAPEDFAAVLLGKEKIGTHETVVLKLTPTEEGLVKTLKIWIGESDHLTRKVEMVDASGKETTYLVSDLRVNTGVPESRFTFKAPEGAEVVDLR